MGISLRSLRKNLCAFALKTAPYPLQRMGILPQRETRKERKKNPLLVGNGEERSHISHLTISHLFFYHLPHNHAVFGGYSEEIDAGGDI